MKKISRIIAAMFAVIFAITSFPAVIVGASNAEDEAPPQLEKQYSIAKLEDKFTDNEVLITVFPSYNKKDYSTDDFAEINCTEIEELMSADETISIPSRIFCLTLAEHSKSNVLEAIKKLELREDIYCADVNTIHELIDDEEDELTPEELTLMNGANGLLSVTYDKEEQWGLDKISITGAWQVTTGSSSVLVGVADTGIYADHPDLINRVNREKSKNFLTAHSAGDEHGLTDVNGGAEGHGTKVAGVIGAQADNQIGIAGVCKNVTLVSLKMLYNSVSGEENTTVGMTKMLNYAKENNIKTINYSIGGPEYNVNEKTAIEAYPGLLICSAGNDNADTDSTSHNNYPSEYDLPNIISVGASTEKDKKRSTSNYGKVTVDLFAPGEKIRSTAATGGYASSSGTSLAAPFVTGVAALILAKDPSISPSEIKATILMNVDKISAFEDLCVSGGRLNAEKALKNIHHHQAYIFKSTGDIFLHTKTCRVCGYETTESHDWIKLAESSYRCRICTMTAKSIPVVLGPNFNNRMYVKGNSSPTYYMTEFTDYIEKYLGMSKSS